TFHTPVMANYWLHNGFLQVEGRKMAKSEGNFTTIRELLSDWAGQVLRFQMLMSHYRQPIDWMAAKSEEAENELYAWSSILIDTKTEQDGLSRLRRKESPIPSASVLDALLDDLNTPEAIAALRANYKLARNGGYKEKRQFLMDCEFLGLLRPDKLWIHLQGVFGENTYGLPVPTADVRKLRISVANNLPDLRQEVENKLASSGLRARILDDGHVTVLPITQETKDLAKRVEELISERNAARKAKDFTEADRIRDVLRSLGIELEDRKDGTTIQKPMR